MPRTQAPLSIEYILLGFLSQGPVHGYDLHKQINNLEGISLVWHIKQGQLYAMLEKLEEIGLLTSKLVPGTSLLMRKEYQITPLGWKTFSTWVSSPVCHGREMRQEFLAKLYFAQKSGDDLLLVLIEEQKLECMQWLSTFEASFSRTGPEQRYERMIFQYRIYQTRAMLAWLDDCQVDLQAAFLQPAGIEQ